MTVTNLVLAFVAGALSMLSPCVLPILPVVFGVAASEHKLGPVALAGGLTISFVAIGLFIATIGYTVGLSAELFRNIAAAIIVGLGAVLMLPALQNEVAVASGPITNWTNNRFGNVGRNGIAGQFWTGVLLGAVWSPCVGPTLGAASLLAAQGRDLPQVSATMFAFGVGTSIPLLILGFFSREVILRWRHRLLSIGQGMKALMGLLLIVVGMFVLTGIDKSLETTLVNASPQWLTSLTTRY